MKYLAILIIPFFIFSCALEKEETDYVDGLFNYTIASVKIDSVNGANTPPACMDFSGSNNSSIRYTIKSSGRYGTDVSPIIKDSEIRISIARLYFNNILVEIPIQSNNIKYDKDVSQNVTLTKETINNANITDGTYKLGIEMVASEYDGNKMSTVLNKTFSSDFGDVIITFNSAGCGN